MPKTSKETVTKVMDFGVVEDRSADLDGYTVNFVTVKQTHDMAPLLKGLPGGNCACPHWGYVFKGRITMRYDGREETYEAGDAFYWSPGHAPEAEAGTELLQFSPARELAETEAAVAKAMDQSPGQ
ncbi:MAG TPA: hypothetical protein VM121_09775 [Acidimicrobiales bacterium]|nr:hypothetical protein [Acidimicrobiales bacterium]